MDHEMLDSLRKDVEKVKADMIRLDAKTDKQTALLAQSVDRLVDEVGKINSGFVKFLDRYEEQRKEIDKNRSDIEKSLSFAKGTWFAFGGIGLGFAGILIKLFS